ncbi:MAG: glycoside hydrolase family 97 protein [Rikenellaceae bacterium]|nr:glycoside hydrolase family 97 protein [Rikenellaceae bacterium]
MKNLLLSIVALLMVCGVSAKRPITLSSPNEQLKATFHIDKKGTPRYTLSFNDEEIIKASPLGIVTTEEDMRSGLRLCEVTHFAEDNTWEPVWGQYATIRDNYNAMSAELMTKRDNVLYIDMRLYDDGLAIRYRLDGKGEATIIDETTSFTLGSDAYNTYWIAGSYDDDEFGYVNTTLSGITRENMELSSSSERKLPYPAVNTPVTMVTERGTHISIHEAALWHYPAMSLRYDAKSNTLTSDLASVGKVKSEVTLPFATPWRVVIVGNRAGALIESSLILNLNEPCRLEDTSWIKPMKYVGVWWEMHLKRSTWDMDGGAPHCATTENVCRYIDFAAENGFGGVLVEGWNEGWGRGERFDYCQPYPDFDIDYITAYARERGVMLIGHHETYANVENYEAQMSDAYAYYASKGVGSVKTGYVGNIANRLHNSRDMVDHYNRTVMEAAEHRLTVDIHEPVHPTGICRTYPNLVSAEGMRGQEWQAWNSGNSISHNTILPFTRNVAGAMDFTPGIFDVRYHNTVNKAAANEEYRVDENYNYTYFVNSTLAHQLALYVVFYSPIQMVADLPENYAEHPKALTFIREVPVDWYTTKVLDAEVGDYVVVARRDKHSNSWYVGGITDGTAREVSLSLDFLDKGCNYKATIYRDSERAAWNTYPTDYVVESKSVTANDTLTVRMGAGGGFAMTISKE